MFLAEMIHPIRLFTLSEHFPAITRSPLECVPQNAHLEPYKSPVEVISLNSSTTHFFRRIHVTKHN